MKKWTNRLITVVGVLLILVAVYLFAKPHIDDYLTKKDNETKIETYDKDTLDNKNQAVEIPKDKTKMAGYLSVPDADIKTPVYPGPATPEQLNRGVSFAEEDESLEDQNIAIAGHTYTGGSDYQFSKLPDAKVGSKVYFKIGNKKKEYEIVKIFDVKPEDIEVLEEQQSAKQQLTLITCDNYNEQTNQWEDRKIFIAKAI
ncbi:class A sortase SrtA [Staphylococcus pseudoxylosus]|uniref:class A sortase SrtA n=1 Tax=Staphylococcus pseudoxylosus TaxID=2282419 RepID=UPI000D1D3644|nr:class A sortase SrtA [Staphylococcus pseudoxylosus]PTI44865.1 class A sortase SrtA [Staphylococcus xylosus]MDW8797827.1 class A sortase SrtA [Staphylococcus pseudoxylosus]MEB6036887.1 class A sortase SrtA [Staphylococcus pseudoxylosus]MEB7764626.1 class A sortase SrtA [Staphylococcus pseudoxylosus]MEB8086297.1 class A sortase SrtA [Staphylococcus pseudoxylosus]